MICPYCQKDHAEEALFCPETGKPITPTKYCPSCGSQADKNALTCPECSQPFQSSQKPINFLKQIEVLNRHYPQVIKLVIIGVSALVVFVVVFMLASSILRQIGSGNTKSSSPVFGLNIPPEVENAIRDVYARGNGTGGWKLEKVSQIEVTGRGVVPNDNYHAGIEEIYCVNVEIDATQDSAGRYFWFSYFVYRTGNYWEVSRASSGQSGWDRYACPGEYSGR